MKIAVWIANHGDGSCGLKFFDNEENAEKAAEEDSERFCEDVWSIDLPLNPDQLKFAVEGQVSTKYDWMEFKQGELVPVEHQ